MDREIRKAVLVLNRAGLPTTGSCAGHADHGSPAPWIKINSEKHLSASQILKLKNCVSSLLKDFYKNRKIDSYIKLRIKSGHAGFWIYSGQDFLKWREIIDERSKMINVGKKVGKEIISRTEQEKRRKTLFARQEEMAAFAHFLAKNR